MIHEILRDVQVVLASASPRRAQLFSLLGIKARIAPADIAEPLTADAPGLQAVQHARNKALYIAANEPYETLVVAADTVVAVKNRILGKPQDSNEAKRFLKLLSDHEHEVFTGICLHFHNQERTAWERTKVRFAKLCESEIDAYIATGEPMDKAGAYGIQGFGAQFITKVDGCYFNVMGFPIRLFYSLLKSIPELHNDTLQ